MTTAFTCFTDGEQERGRNVATLDELQRNDVLIATCLTNKMTLEEIIVVQAHSRRILAEKIVEQYHLIPYQAVFAISDEVHKEAILANWIPGGKL